MISTGKGDSPKPLDLLPSGQYISKKTREPASIKSNIPLSAGAGRTLKSSPGCLECEEESRGGGKKVGYRADTHARAGEKVRESYGFSGNLRILSGGGLPRRVAELTAAFSIHVSETDALSLSLQPVCPTKSNFSHNGVFSVCANEPPAAPPPLAVSSPWMFGGGGPESCTARALFTEPGRAIILGAIYAPDYFR